MSSTDHDGQQANRARLSLDHLRRILKEARDAADAERIHLALIDAVEGLIAHTERQAGAIDELRSDLGHKQGIVTRIGGGEFLDPATTAGLREFAAGPDGSRWFLGRDAPGGVPHVVHRADPPNGGGDTRIDVGAFLGRDPSAPERLALLRLIGSLVE